MKTFAILVSMTILGAMAAVACGDSKPANDPSSASTMEGTATPAATTISTTTTTTTTTK